MRPNPFRFRLGSFLLGLTVLSIALALIVPRFRPPSEAEVQAIRIAEKEYVTKYLKKPDLIKARRLTDGSWMVEMTMILNPIPSGLRVTDFYRVDAHSKCTWEGIHERGSY